METHHRRFSLHQYQTDCRRISIFLPAAGNRWDTDLNNVGNNGNYWSSSLNENNPNNAWNLNFNSNNVNPWNNNNRNNGFSVRPVCPGVQHLPSVNTYKLWRILFHLTLRNHSH